MISSLDFLKEHKDIKFLSMEKMQKNSPSEKIILIIQFFSMFFCCIKKLKPK